MSKIMDDKKKARQLFLNALMPLITVTFLTCTIFGLMSSKILEFYVKAHSSSLIEKFNGEASLGLEPCVVNLTNLANFTSETQDPDTLRILVRELVKTLPNCRGIYFASYDFTKGKGGLFVDSAGWEPPENFDVATRGWFKNAVARDGNMHFEDAYTDADTGKQIMTVSMLVKDSRNVKLGVVAVDIFADNLASITDVKVSENGTTSILDLDGRYLLTSDASKMGKDFLQGKKDLKISKTDWYDGSVQAYVSSKNYYAVGRIGKFPYYFAFEGPSSDFTSKVTRTIVLIEIVMFAFSFGCSVRLLQVIIKMRKDEKVLGLKIFDETQNLVVAAKENAATSQDQSAAVKEIVATMEDSNALSENISTKIKDVSKVAENSSVSVEKGVSSIEKNVEQLHAIFNANQQTISGMKDLSDRIESIWDIVTLINNVADQAKIIAFNAELEASSAGEAGKSFRIVANEIRRLSDSIIDGTKEIKDKITEIQHSSDSLILASESGTEKINAGYENAKDLKLQFESIKSSSEITATSAKDITDIIQQQTVASEQILIALKQISAGVENFTAATDNISSSAENLRTLADGLNSSMVSKDDKDKDK